MTTDDLKVGHDASFTAEELIPMNDTPVVADTTNGAKVRPNTSTQGVGKRHRRLD